MHTHNFIQRFIRSNWITRAKTIISDPAKLRQILQLISSMQSKGGLRSVRSKLRLFTDYARDIASGRYKGYSTTSLILIVATLLYVVTPTDFIPDFLPAGFIDDVSIVVWAFSKLKKELDTYEQKRSKNVTP